jgi:hypothetical protein
MNKKIKIATFIISSNTHPAIRNIKAQKKIYLNFQKNIFWYRQGNKNQLSGKKANLINNDLFLDISDDTLSMGKKTLMALEWAENNIDYDFIVRPTPSSYVNFKNLENFINSNFKLDDIVYAGKIQATNDKNGNQIEFVSGSTLLLSKKCVQIIIKNKNLWDHSYWDDVGLSLLLKKAKVPSFNVERSDIPGNPYLNNVSLGYYQYRCRADNHYGYPRFIESHVLKYIHKVSNGEDYSRIKKFIYSGLIEILRNIYIYQFGWKVYSLFRKLFKLLLPKKVYLYLKNKFIKQITSFKLIRFKT